MQNPQPSSSTENYTEKPNSDISTPVSQANLKPRHYSVIVSFIVCVLLPLFLTISYLYIFAADQYASKIGFAVRSEQTEQGHEVLGGIIGGGSPLSNDSQILFEYIQSQQIVEKINQNIDLWKLYSKPKRDIYFKLKPSGSIEELLHYWKKMVSVYYDSNSGLIHVEARAFTAKDAHTISNHIFVQSSKLINEISSIASDDSVTYAKKELTSAIELLKKSRLAMSDFRNKTQIIDPISVVESQITVIATLQTQLAEALLEIDLLKETTKLKTGDLRLNQALKKKKIIEQRIQEEKKKFGVTDDTTGELLSRVVGEYEAITVDQEFAKEAYIAARATYDNALFQAQRKSRYLASFEKPTLPEIAEHPQRINIILIIAAFLVLGWLTIILILYSLQDRR